MARDLLPKIDGNPADRIEYRSSRADLADRVGTLIRALEALADGDEQQKIGAFTPAISSYAEGFDIAWGGQRRRRVRPFPRPSSGL